MDGKRYLLTLNNSGKRAAKMSVTDMASDFDKNPLGSPTMLFAVLVLA